MAARGAHPSRLRARARRGALAGCNVGPDFAPPDPGLPNGSFSARSLSPRNPAPPSPTWWKAFRDPVLTELEARVAAANLDVQDGDDSSGGKPLSARRRGLGATAVNQRRRQISI